MHKIKKKNNFFNKYKLVDISVKTYADAKFCTITVGSR